MTFRHPCIFRWRIIPSSPLVLPDSLTVSDMFLTPLIIYLSWQCLYLFILEVLLASWVRDIKDLQFSLR